MTPARGAKTGLQTFVIAHSQDLVLECERLRRFSHLPSYTYLFVGAADTSRLAAIDNVIVARDLPDNIEHHPHLLSFTGWYAIARNTLASSDWVSVLEYDVDLEPAYAQASMKELQSTPCIVGYLQARLTHPIYLQATPWLSRSLSEVYGIDLPKLLVAYLEGGGLDQWTTTSNASLATAQLSDFVDWFLPLTRVFRHDPLGAHVHERAVPVYCMVRGLANRCVPGVLSHQQRRSHGVKARAGRQVREAAADTWFGQWVRARQARRSQ